MHIDTEEGNAAGIKTERLVKLSDKNHAVMYGMIFLFVARIRILMV
jgi:hypothetical protein